jgi:hypothetical protein
MDDTTKAIWIEEVKKLEKGQKIELITKLSNTLTNLMKEVDRENEFRNGKEPQGPCELGPEDWEVISWMQDVLRKGGVECEPMQPATHSPPRIPQQPPPVDDEDRITTPNNPYAAHTARAIVAAESRTRNNAGKPTASTNFHSSRKPSHHGTAAV